MTITVSDASALDITGDLTIEVWAKLETNTKNVHALVGKDNAYGLAVGVGDNTYPGFVMKIGDGSTIQSTLDDGQRWIDDTWHHFAGTYSDSNDRMRLYVDGRQVAQNLSVSSSLGTNASDLLFTEWVSQGWDMTGDIDEVRLWSEERTPIEINNNRFNDLSGGETNLNGYWPMKNGSGTTITDDTANDNDATLSNDGEWVERDIDVSGFLGSPLSKPGVGLSKPEAPVITNKGTYQGGNGQIFAYFDVELQSLPRGAKYQQLIYRRDGSSNWEMRTQTSNTSAITVTVDGLSPTVGYEVASRTFSYTNDEGPAIVFANDGNVITTSNDTTAPSWDSNDEMRIRQGTGKTIEVEWDKNDADDLFEYFLYRNTSNTKPSSTIAELQSTQYNDANITYGTKYYYWVEPTDEAGNAGPAPSNAPVSFTATRVPDEETDQTAPNTPNAIDNNDISSPKTFRADDGGIRSQVTITLDPLPNGAKYQNLLLRYDSSNNDLSGSSNNPNEWKIQDQRENENNSVDIVVDDLTPGITYEVTVQAFSFNGVPSSKPTPNSFTADTKDIPPNNVNNFKAEYYDSGVKFTWEEVPDSDVKYYIIKREVTGDGQSWSNMEEVYKNIEKPAVIPVNLDGYDYWIKAQDRSGNQSNGKTKALKSYNLDNLSLNSTLDISNNVQDPSYHVWDNDGDRFHVRSSFDGKVYQYNLSNSFDFNSTISFDTSVDPSFNFGSMDWSDDDGKDLILSTGNDDAELSEGSVSTSYDISDLSVSNTTTYNSNFATGEDADAFTWGKSGNKGYIITHNIDTDTRKVKEYNAGTKYDHTSLNFVDEKDITSSTGSGFMDLFISEDGNKLFVLDRPNDRLVSFEFSISWNITTISQFNTKSIGSGSCVNWSNDGTKCYITDNSNDSIKEYTVS